jgi:hypothetical protein
MRYDGARERGERGGSGQLNRKRGKAPGSDIACPREEHKEKRQERALFAAFQGAAPDPGKEKAPRGFLGACGGSF